MPSTRVGTQRMLLNFTASLAVREEPTATPEAKDLFTSQPHFSPAVHVPKLQIPPINNK